MRNLTDDQPQIGDRLIARQVIRGWCDDAWADLNQERFIVVQVVFVYRDGRIQARDNDGQGYKWTFEPDGSVRSVAAKGIVHLVRERRDGRVRWKRAPAAASQEGHDA